ncbi:cytochrome P450 [Gymnopus androsaceus JB14]|uniref:Cytochrome P450 n=1 Tax=Gymnopus androsaceus JB14 TaxID=1447944 RepID=A0A6A4I6E3_9AGAR|nr:cytochrome P450 [Gymnopus androsaceus JB14]
MSTPHFDSYFSYLTQVVKFPGFLAALVSIFVVNRIWVFLHGLRSVHHLPGYRPPFHPMGLPAVLFPTTWWNTSVDVHWARRSSLYTDNETISIVPTLIGEPTIWTSNLNVARQVASGGNRTTFFKPTWSARALLLWGLNLFAAEGEVWRKHRRVMGPAFNNELYRLVWRQTLKTYHEMIATERWEEKGTVDIPVIQNLTFKLALQVLGTCAFGFPLSWDEPPRTASGSLSIQEVMRSVADTHMLRIIAPKWVLRLPFQKIQQSNVAYESMASFMNEQVAGRKMEIQDNDSKDAFTLLVKANEQEESKYKLSDDELVGIGNIFVMLFAGHETTAHALAATLGFLAINQDAQDEVFEQINEVVGHDRDPEFEDYQNLNKVLAAFFEALRFFPSGHLLIREASEDTILEIPNPRGQEGTTSMAISKGQVVIMDASFLILASHFDLEYNPRYFEDPTLYRPSRWHGMNNDSEDFTAFSIGPRACIGRKFATTEVTCFLTMLLRDWKVTPKLNEGESQEEWKTRVLDAKIVLTLGVRDVPLTFVKRK